MAARNLLGFGYRPRVLLTHSPEELSEDSRINFERYRCLPLSRWSIWDPEQGDEVFEGNPRSRMVTRTWDGMDAGRREELTGRGRAVINGL